MECETSSYHDPFETKYDLCKQVVNLSSISMQLLPIICKINAKRLSKIWGEMNNHSASCRYRWTPKYLPSTCPCGKRFDVDHAMSCMKGGFVHRRHDDVRDQFASLLKDVCLYVLA